ncbi:MAG: hypothetical protein AAFP20_12605 [Cyanobacteria bacterium J06614_10]
MSSPHFSLQAAVNQFEIKYIGSDLVFPTVLPLLPPNADSAMSLLTQQLDRDTDIARRNPTDQAKSAFVIAPVLSTLRQIHQVGIHTGVQFDIAAPDDPFSQANCCDFIVTLSDELEIIEAPVLVVVQAKQSVMAEGVGRCVAKMVTAQAFNLNSGLPPLPIFGCVTNGFCWRFLQLSGDVVRGDAAIEYRLRPTTVLMQRLYYTVNAGIAL